MRVREIRPEYGPGGAATVELPGAVYRICGISGADRADLDGVVFLSQVHGSDILLDPVMWSQGDGMILPAGGKCPGVRTADCLPVFLGSAGFCAGFHAGWRGLAAGIAGEMVRLYPEPPEIAVLGNCICPGCYTVGDDVRTRVSLASGYHGGPSGRLDLRNSALCQMEEAGLPADTIVYSIPDCTMCREDLFHSFRRDGTAERNLQWIRMER